MSSNAARALGLLLLLLCVFPGLVWAAPENDKPVSRNHPLFTRMLGTYIMGANFNFDSFNFNLELPSTSG